MAKNDLLLLDTIIDERALNKNPSSKKDEVFEFLAYEQVLKEYDLSADDIKMGSVDGKDDGGIDAIFVLVNGHLIGDIKDAIFPKSNANLEVYFFTCKHRDKFKQDPINSIFTSLEELLDFSKKDSELDGIYNEAVLEKRNIFRNTYIKVASILEHFCINVIFASRGDEENELGENVEARGHQIETLCKEYFSGCDAKFEFWGAAKILEEYRKKPDYSLELEVEESLTHGKQMAVLATLKNYYKFITYDDKKIRKYLFDSNVRDYMGLNAVNQDIMETLRQPTENEDFWWLNNGITVLCSSAVAVGKTISIENVQIVNGLQTSECIYRHLTEYDEDDDRTVLIKILPCDNSVIADDITRSTNNQTAVMSSSLRATDKLQEDIEEILKKNDLYYERRVNYYANQGISAEKIFSPLYLAAGYMALVKKRPFNAVTLKQRFMRKDSTYRDIFSENDNINVWPQIAKIMRMTDGYIHRLPDGEKKGDRFLKNVRYLVSFLTVSRLHGTFTYSLEALVNFDINSYSFEEFCKTWEDIRIAKPDTSYTTWRSKKVVLDIMESVACIENIRNFKAIDTRGINRNDITDELLNQVKAALPKDRPWEKGIHKKIANELNISNGLANRTIERLIKTGMI